MSTRAGCGILILHMACVPQNAAGNTITMHCRGVLPCSGIHPHAGPLCLRALYGRRSARKKARNDHEKTTAQHPAHRLHAADAASGRGLCRRRRDSGDGSRNDGCIDRRTGGRHSGSDPTDKRHQHQRDPDDQAHRHAGSERSRAENDRQHLYAGRRQHRGLHGKLRRRRIRQ